MACIEYMKNMHQKQGGLRSHANDHEAWEVEIQALKDIQEGKTKMEVQSADELLKELKDLEENE